MEAMIPSQVGMSLRTLKKIKEAKEAQRKKREAKEAHQKKRNKKMREKERRNNATILLVLQSSSMIFMIESVLCCHFYTSQNFTL